MHEMTLERLPTDIKPAKNLISLVRFTVIVKLLLFFSYANCAIAAPSPGIDLPKQSLVPGGVYLLPIESAANTTKPPLVTYQNKPVLIIPKGNSSWLAVIGIPLSAKLGQHQVKIQWQNFNQTKYFNIHNKEYPSEHLTIKDNNKVTPNPVSQQRIIKERQKLKQIYATWNPKSFANLKLQAPVPGRHSSSFGRRRILNGIAKKPHSGLDIAAVKGTPVKAAKAGTVIEVGNYFYSGNVVFIDHGQGFITNYCHLDTTLVEVGQKVTTNDTIGTVGNTGRVTGAHLHWSVILNRFAVDPKLFI